MKIGLLSDTHGYLDENLFEYFNICDQIWHAGDVGSWEIVEHLRDWKPLRAVYGNIDYGPIKQQLPEHEVFECEGLQVWITHIGGYPPQYSAKIKKLLEVYRPGLFICGHSHILKAMPDPARGLLHLNPGAAGHEGFHHMRTAMRFDVAEGKVANLEVIELGRRGKRYD